MIKKERFVHRYKGRSIFDTEAQVTIFATEDVCLVLITDLGLNVPVAEEAKRIVTELRHRHLSDIPADRLHFIEQKGLDDEPAEFNRLAPCWGGKRNRRVVFVSRTPLIDAYHGDGDFAEVIDDLWQGLPRRIQNNLRKAMSRAAA